MANIRISQLPTAPSPITGAELVPIVQNGQTVQTTVQAITQSPTQTQTFLTVGAQASLPNSRYIGGGLGIGSADGGAQGLYSLYLDGTSGSLENSATGIIVKSGVNTITSRLIAAGTTGLSVANGNGISGNPTISLTGLALSAATLSGSGIVSVVSGSYYQQVQLTGTTSQISIANPNGGSNPTFSIADNPILPGAAGTLLPYGTTSDRASVPTNGTLRYNTDLGLFEGYANGAWGAITTGSGVTSIATGTGLTGGPITTTGTISIASTGVTAATYGSGTQVPVIAVNAQGQITSASNTTITAGGIGAVASVSGTANEITSSGTTNVTLSLPTALTFTGKTVTGGTFNMTTATVGSDTVTTNTASQTLTNKTISGSSNTLSNIANSSLTNSSITLGTTTISLGSTSLAPAGLTSVTVTQDPVSALQLATKQYVDAVAQGLDAKASVVNASTTAYTATYANGTAGVGATLTNSGTLVAFSADGVTNSVGDRVLIKTQAAPAQNGIYTVTTAGSGAVAWVLTRATDMDTWAEVPNSFVFVESGTVNADTGWVCTSNAGGTMGTTAITWVQFSGAGTYTAGTGLTLTGTQFSLTAPVTTALGGTGSTSALTQYGVVYGSSTSVMATTSAGTSTQVLHGNASGAPTFGAVSLTADVSGTLPVGNGGTGVATLTGLAYGNGTSAFTAATAAQVVAVISTTAVTNATNATNLALTAGSGATNYITYSASATGNAPQFTSTGLTYNATNTAITGGINGGTF